MYFIDIEVEDLMLLKHISENKHLIILKPAFERWTFSKAEKAGINPSGFTFL